METMERKKPRPRRSFTPEFKAEIVELCQRGERSIGQVARDFDLTETNVRTWVKQAEIDQGARPGLTTEEKEELTRLRRENRSLKEDVEILKRATVFCSRRPVTIIRIPLESESATFSARSRQHTTSKNDVASCHSWVVRSCQRRLTAMPSWAVARPSLV